MTVSELIEKLQSFSDNEKVVVISDGEGWSNIASVETKSSFISINEDRDLVFSDDKNEPLICDICKSGLIDYPEIERRTCSCGGLGYNVEV